MPGHIEWLDDDRCNIIIDEGRDPATGKRKRQKHVFHCHGQKKRAPVELARLLTLQEQGLLIDPSKMTVAEFFTKWLADYAALETEATTYHRYAEIVHKAIIPNLGQISVQQLKPLHVQNFEVKMQTEGKRTRKKVDGKLTIVAGPLAKRTVMQYHRIMHCALACAVEWQIVVQNVVDHVKPPKVKRRKIKVGVNVLDFEQAIAMLTAARETQFWIQIVLATLTGMRRGEIYGLKWSDIDFELGTITTNQAAQYVPGEKLPDKLPKDDDVRIIDMADHDDEDDTLVIDILKAYEAEQNARKLNDSEKYNNPEGYLCVDKHGNRLHPDVVSKNFPKWIVSIGLPRVRFHDLRHTHASLMLALGNNLKLVSVRLGHSSVSITGDIYGHLLPGQQKQASKGLEQRLLGGKKAGAEMVPKPSTDEHTQPKVTP